MELRRSSHYDGFESNSERDIKSVFQIDYQLTDEYYGEILEIFAIKCKLGLRLFLFFTSKTKNIWCVAHSVICGSGCSRKNPNGGLRIYFFENPGIFHFFTLPMEIPDKTKLSAWIFHRIVLDPLEIPRPKTDPWNFHIIFSWSPFGNSILLLINPWKFHMLFL